MQSVTLGTLSLLVALFPFGLLVAALKISNWRQHVRLAEIARQITVTDAIHAELGAGVVREQLAGSVRQRPPFRVALGLALINVGRKLQGSHAAVGAPATGASAAS